MSVTLGLTGIIGTGKSTAAKFISEKYNFYLISADQVGHQLLAEDKKINAQIQAEFETTDRKKLAKLIFADPVKLNRLNEILHPAMFKAIKKEITAQKKLNKNILIEAALLYQISLDIFCDKIICIKSDAQSIKQRLKQTGLTDKELNERLANAPVIPEEECIVVENNGSPAELMAQLQTILKNT